MIINSLHLNYYVIVWRRRFGGEKLRIGELAEATGITKRTIDHYTNLGLLKAERSASNNYRYYSIEMITRMKEIEEKKRQGLSLDQIKKLLDNRNREEIDIQDLRLRLQALEKDVSQLIQHLNHCDKNGRQFIKKELSGESMALMQSLLLLLNI